MAVHRPSRGSRKTSSTSSRPSGLSVPQLLSVRFFACAMGAKELRATVASRESAREVGRRNDPRNISALEADVYEQKLRRWNLDVRVEIVACVAQAIAMELLFKKRVPVLDPEYIESLKTWVQPQALDLSMRERLGMTVREALA